MDFAVFHTLLNSTSSASQYIDTNLATFPNTVLEVFIPGYSLISKFILQAIGFDVGLVVSLGIIIVAFIKTSGYLFEWAQAFFFTHFTSYVYINDDDDLFRGVMEWIAEQRMAKVSRSIKAVTRYSNLDFEQEDENSDNVFDEDGIFNVGKWSAKIPPRYEPYFGTHHFWYKRRLFFFVRSRRERSATLWTSAEQESIQLICVGRSTKPIKFLLDSLKSWSLDREKSMTVIRRPAGKDRNHWSAWERVSSRPSRPMDTVSLDSVQKRKIIEDVNTYLQPSAAVWYATRGIPYRRGYLFHGPPGTGKTSLSFALAGIFGLDIYVISLNEKGMTEFDLSRLFNELPRRCIVLLEDIDSAGIKRDKEIASDKEGGLGTSESNKEDEKLTTVELAKAIKSVGKDEDAGETKGISLSSLLNVIDGVASHEGRVLVMTTNHPEKLDEALIRPGRVDMQIAFTLATHDQARDIFVRMYSGEGFRSKSSKESKKKMIGSPIMDTPYNHMSSQTQLLKSSEGYIAIPSPPLTPITLTSAEALSSFPDQTFHNDEKALSNFIQTDDELTRLGELFASEIPENKFTPAEIQGFLLMRKNNPHQALEDIVLWRDGLLEAKRRKLKVLNVS